jgi:chromosome segregation and condensation protein ScpB
VTDGDEVEEFGTIMMKEFLILVDPEELSCEEIETALKTSNPLVDSKALLQEIHASVKGDVDKDDGGDLVRVGKFNVYSTARRILEYVGKMTRTELSRNYFTSGTKLG